MGYREVSHGCNQHENRKGDGLVSGIGFDLIDLSDFTRTLKRSGERFIQRIYTKEEIEYCRAQPHPVQSFAVRFAAKEAANRTAKDRTDRKSTSLNSRHL